jgi:MFS family permease
LGLVTLLTLTAANASIQLSVDPLRRGRVMALYITVLMGGTAIGSPILGWVAETMGPRWAVIGGGTATMIGVLASVALLQIRSRRQRASNSGSS